MLKSTEIEALFVIALIAIAAAYFVDQSSHNSSPGNNSSFQPTNIVTNPPSQQLSTDAQQPVFSPSSPQPVADEASNLTANSNIGLACETIANEAARNNQSNKGTPTTVLRSHFSHTFNQCYYELSIAETFGGTETDIRVAPDDTWVAYCSFDSSGTICNERNHQGLETQAMFQQLETKYLTN